jgi:LacI family transcriptional regulator
MDVLGRVTMTQVAQRAGVSRSAVSAAFTDRPTTVGLNPATRAQIHKIAKELGYRPNILSRSFIKQRSYLIGMLGSEAFFPFALETNKGIEDALETTDFSLLSFYHGNDAQDQTKHLQKCISRRVDGMIIVGAPERADGPNHRLIKQLQDAGMPIVQIHRKMFGNVPLVAMDDEQSGYLAARHLIESGHRHIAHVTHSRYRDQELPGQDANARNRCDGYQRAMREAGFESTVFTFDRSGIFGLGPNDYSGYCAALAKRLATSSPRFTAVTTFNDYTTIGLLHNLNQLRVRVPEDISIIGYDNIEAGMLLMHPALTTVRPKLFEIGHVAAKMILEMMDGQSADDVLLKPELVVRGSTLPHNG